jgi:hypothetical protein
MLPLGTKVKIEIVQDPNGSGEPVIRFEMYGEAHHIANMLHQSCENHSKLRLLFTVVNQVLRKNEAKKVDCENAIDELLLMENCKN